MWSMAEDRDWLWGANQCMSWPTSCSSGGSNTRCWVILPGPSASLRQPGSYWLRMLLAGKVCLGFISNVWPPFSPMLTCSSWSQHLKLCCPAHCYKACCQCLSKLIIHKEQIHILLTSSCKLNNRVKLSLPALAALYLDIMVQLFL